MKLHFLQDMDILCNLELTNMIYYVVSGKIITIDNENNFDVVYSEVKRIRKLNKEGKNTK